MTDPSQDGRVTSHGHLGFRSIQTAIIGLVSYGAVSGDLVLVVNGLLGLLTTELPSALHRYGKVNMSRRFVFGIGIAVLLHTVGMAGPYETIWWWDHLTHTLSAALLATVGYAVARTLEDQSTDISLPADFLFVYVIVFTLAAGVLWEVFEFVGRTVASSIGHQPILVQYGLQDTVLDLLFDGVGATVAGILSQRWKTSEKMEFDSLFRSTEDETVTNRKSP